MIARPGRTRTTAVMPVFSHVGALRRHIRVGTEVSREIKGLGSRRGEQRKHVSNDRRTASNRPSEKLESDSCEGRKWN